MRKLKKKSQTKKVLLSVTILIFVFSLTAGVAFAEGDISALLNSWFNKKIAISMNSLNDAIKSETEIQKERLVTELRKKIENSSRDLDNFTVKQKDTSRQEIQDYASQLIESKTFSNEEDKQQILSKLNEILDSSKSAIDNLLNSYVPPTPTYTPLVEDPSPKTDVSPTENPVPTPLIDLPVDPSKVNVDSTVDNEDKSQNENTVIDEVQTPK